MSDNPASWQADPTGRHDHRYWDGTEWTEHVADAGVSGIDPYDEPASAPVAAPEPTTGPIGWATPEPTAEPEPEPEPPASETSLTGWAVPARPEPADSRPAWGVPTPTPIPTPSPDPEPEPTSEEPEPEPTPEPEQPLSWTATPGPTETTTPEPDPEPATAWRPSWSAPAPTPTRSPEPDVATPAAAAGIDPTTSWSPEPTTVREAPAQPVDEPRVAAGVGGGEPNRSRRRRILLLLVGLLLIAAVVAAIVVLGGDDADPETSAVNDLSSQFEAQLGGLTEAQADCLAEGIVGAIGAERAQDLDIESDPPQDIATEVQGALTSSIDSCEIDPQDLVPTSSGAGTTGDTAADDATDVGAGGAVPGGDGPASAEGLQAFEDLYAQGFRDSYDLTEEESRCIAKALTDAVREGRVTESESSSAIHGYLADCGIDPARLETPAE